MIAYVNGTVAYKDPAYAIIDVNGVGYEVKISLQTYTSSRIWVNVASW